VSAHNRDPVIVGVGLSDYPRAPHLSPRGHHVQAMQRALEDAGLNKRDIDGYMTTEAGIPGAEEYSLPEMAEYLQIDHRWLDGTFTGGSAFEFMMQHAAAAIRLGMAETILMTYGSSLFSHMGRSLGTNTSYEPVGAQQYEMPYGSSIVSAYAMAARRHMHQYGTSSEQLAHIAVAARQFAAMNPNAMYQDPITVDDVLDSRMISDPLHLLDCCVVSDGGGAVIATTAERARDLRQPPVYVLGTTGRQTHWNISQNPNFASTAAALAGPEAFAQAGITHDDVDMLMLYDSFTITVLLLLESLGFCKPGEGGPFVTDGRLAPGGSLPINTDGGGLSSCHPGMRGMFLLIEAARQIRGQAGPAQVPDCNVAVAAGSGGWLACMGVTVLGAEATR